MPVTGSPGSCSEYGCCELLIENALPTSTWSVGLVPAVDQLPCSVPGLPLDWPLALTTFTSNRSSGSPGTQHGTWSTAGTSPTDHVLVGSAFSINSSQQPYSLHDPGEPVTGTLSNLYPFS